MLLEIEIHEDCEPHANFVVHHVISRINEHNCNRKGVKVKFAGRIEEGIMEPEEEDIAPVG